MFYAISNDAIKNNLEKKNPESKTLNEAEGKSATTANTEIKRETKVDIKD